MMTMTDEIRNHPDMSLGRKILIATKLSLPIILAQITTIAMQYIDSAMVGQLGEDASAAIGLVSSSIWLVNGVTSSAIYGYSVQVAHMVGAQEEKASRSLFRQGLKVVFLFSLLMMALSVSISSFLPSWLGADEIIWNDASGYFLIVSLFLPVTQLRFYLTASLQATGDTKTPGILSVLMCVLNVIFNAFLINDTLTLSPKSAAFSLTIHGLGMGVRGAALATGLSGLVIALITFFFARKNRYLKTVKGESARIDRDTLKHAASISFPMAIESAALSGAMVASTRIVAPLGSVSIAANSFAVTAESFCYMPGYGLETSATTLVGQSIGAEHKDLARSFAWVTTIMGMIIMTLTGILMYFISPYVLSFLTPVEEVSSLGVKVLRIELLAEPFFGASIVACGAMRGAGDTFIPSMMNLFSIWVVRITLSILLVGSMGLVGCWIAMCVELTFRGIIFLIRLAGHRWMK